VTAADLVVACDNHCRVFLNGVEVAANDDWERPTRVDVAKHFVSGENVLAVEARDDGGPAALVLWLDWRAPGANGALVTDGTWKCTPYEEEGFAALHHDDRRWPEVACLGEVARGHNVWGYPPKGQDAAEGPHADRDGTVLVVVDEAERKRTKSQSDVRSLADAVRMYRVLKGKLPESLDVLAARDERGRSEIEELPADPYGRAYVLKKGDRPNEFEVVCLGPDGKEGTADDVSSKTPK
jgi:hypothetical protein